MKSYVAAIAVSVLALTLAGVTGCQDLKECRPGTAFVTLRCPAGVAVDHFEVDARDLTSNRGGALAPIAAHCPSTGFELKIPDYASGHNLRLIVRAMSAANVEVAGAEMTVALRPECTAIALSTVSPAGDGGTGGTGGIVGPDGSGGGTGGADVGGAGGSGGGASSGGAGGSGGAAGRGVGGTGGGASGGAPGTGGAAGRGTGSGGVASGGAPGSGGGASGGAPGTGGAAGRGPGGSGAAGRGTGGAVTTGGAPGSGGSPGCGTPTTTCVGNTLTVCQASGSISMTNCPQGCNTTRLQCNTCAPATPATCTGGAVQRCRSDGSGYDSTPCANGCRTDQTDCLVCTASQHVCSSQCVSNTSVQTCGQSCSVCPAVPNAQPSCNGTTCGFTCDAGTLQCSPGTNYCEKTSWPFETALEGWFSPSAGDRADDTPLALSTVRAHGGTRSVSAHVSFSVPKYAFRLTYTPCGRPFATPTGPTLDLRGRTVSFWIFLAPDTAGVPATGHLCYLAGFAEGDVCVGCGGAGSPVTPGTWSQVSWVVGTSSPAATISNLSIDCRPVTEPSWTGNVYVDDISIQ